jgi:8-oxo-dGTP pyrophosphatase MutT (NUDIX family)
MMGDFHPRVGGRIWLRELPVTDCVAVLVPAPVPGLVLAVQRLEDLGRIDPPRLCMPGGKVRTREAVRWAAVRELAEETGIDLDPAQVIYLGAAENESSRGGKITVAVYLAPLGLEPNLELAEPGLLPRWHPLDDLCDEQRHDRFARPAKLARLVTIGC